MSVPAAVLLGVLQGLTEFLPVSSSGHLVIAQHFVPGFHQPGVLFDVVLHLGTLLAVVSYFRRDLLRLTGAFGRGPEAVRARRLLLLLGVGTAPAVAAALAAGPLLERAFAHPGVAGGGLVLTAALLLVSRRLEGAARPFEALGPADALAVGLFQGAALVPGVSRSGATIVAGMARGLAPPAAARFSFLLSVPAILGATVYDLPSVAALTAEVVPSYVAGFASAFVVGYGSIGLVLRFVAEGRLHWFGYYCLALGGTVLVYVAHSVS